MDNEIEYEICNAINIGDSKMVVQEKLGKLYIRMEEYDDPIYETQRLDHSHNSNCKCVTFEFDEDDLLIEMNRVY